MKLFKISRNVQHAQSYGCWLCIHINYTAIYFYGWWKKWQGFRLEINAPVKSQNRKDKNNINELGVWKFSW